MCFFYFNPYQEKTAEFLGHVFERKLSLRKSQGCYHMLLIALKTTYINLACRNQVLHAGDVHNVLFSVVYTWAFLYMTHFQSRPTAAVHTGVWITLMQLQLSYFSVLLFIVPINIALLSLSPSFPLPVLVERVILQYCMAETLWLNKRTWTRQKEIHLSAKMHPKREM